MTNWLLGLGPGGRAPVIGQSTLQTRKDMMLNKTPGHDLFGTWILTVHMTGNDTGTTVDITKNITFLIDEVIVGLNSHIPWEQDIGVFTMDIDPIAVGTDIR